MLSQADFNTIIYREDPLHDGSNYHVISGELRFGCGFQTDKRFVPTDLARAEIRRRIWDHLYGDLIDPIAKLRYAVLSLVAPGEHGVDQVKPLLDQLVAKLTMPEQIEREHG